MVDPFDVTRQKHFTDADRYAELLVRVFDRGELVYDAPPLTESRAHTIADLGRLHETQLRFLNPHTYPVGLERSLFDLRTDLIMQARGIE